MAYFLCHTLLMIWLFQTDIQLQESKDKWNARKRKYNTCIISMMLPILCWYARRCRQFRVWNISYRFPASWIKKKQPPFSFDIILIGKLQQSRNQMSCLLPFAAQSRTVNFHNAWQWARQLKGGLPLLQPQSHIPLLLRRPGAGLCPADAFPKSPLEGHATNPFKQRLALSLAPFLKPVVSENTFQSSNCIFPLLG